MDMFDGVGRRQDRRNGQLVNIGAASLNGRERNLLFRNDRDGTFTDVAFVNRADRVEDGRGITRLDYDGDGALDLVLRNYRQPAVLLRNLGGRGHWIAVKLVGSRSNRDGVGARLRLRTARGLQTREVSAGSGYLSSSSLVQHFGLGSETRIEELEIRWPSGARSVLRDLEADRKILVHEGEDRPEVAQR